MDNPYLFQTVKESVDIVEVARRYGLEPDRNGWCRCPFHGEKTPSFHLYHQRYKCFGCGASGDALDLVAGINNIGPLEAVKELNQGFALGIDLDAPADTEAILKARVERMEKERFRSWREEAIHVLTEYYRTLHLAKVHGDSKDPKVGVSDRYVFAAREIDKMGYYLDFVCYEDETKIKPAMPVIDQVVARVRREGGIGEKR